MVLSLMSHTVPLHLSVLLYTCEYIFELIHKVRPDRAKNRKIPVYRRVGCCVILSGVNKELKIMELETVTDYG